jgi:hypothetical protein
MGSQIKHVAIGLAVLFVAAASPSWAQQKGQYVPGQFGLNAGVLPDAGFTYSNLSLNYRAKALRDANGDAVPVTGTYEFWVIENLFFYVPTPKVAGAKLVLMAMVPAANGSLTLPRFDVSGTTGYAMSDTWVQPATLGWHFERADVNAAYAFVVPSGRYTAGATDNVGSGYWGNHVNSGATVYLTKNKGTTANVFGNWEIHGRRKDTDITPGQAFTMEWGLGQAIPLDSNEHKLLQFGVIGYDQWRVSDDGGTFAGGLPASLTPRYSVHAIGFQANYVMPAIGLSFYGKFEPEYQAIARPKGRTIVFGGAYRLPVQKGGATP